MEFATFAARVADVESEPADLEVVSLVAALLADAGDDLGRVARFVQGRVFPAHESATLDVGPRLCYAALARAAGPNVSADDVEARLADRGEIGDVAASYDLSGQQGLSAFGDGRDALTVAEVDARLRELAAADGAGSRDTKLDTLFGLFSRCSPAEARYLARLVLSEMRIGVGSGTVRDAVVEAFDVPADVVERALQVTNDHGHVARVARDEGADGLAGQSLSVGRPVQAMLAQAGTVTGALEDWDAAAVETKFDGARVQVHHDGDGTRLFSRNMEAVTDALPEVVAFVERTLDTQAILDGEVVAVDDAGDPLPFQAVLRRFRRKHDVAAAREDVELRLHVFDCLHADGEDLLDAPLTERHDRLVDLLGPSDDDADRERDPGGGVSELRILEDTDAVADVEAAALDAGHEGIMLKRPDSTYTPGRRGRNWRKRKPDVETLDCVVVGAEWGEGRRAEQFGTFLLGVRDGEGYETVGKVATGVTDEELAALTERLEPHVRTQDGKTVELAPAVVFEVGYEEIQRSPTYSAGHALRFPRFLGVREDRTPANADTLDRVERLAADD